MDHGITLKTAPVYPLGVSRQGKNLRIVEPFARRKTVKIALYGLNESVVVEIPSSFRIGNLIAVELEGIAISFSELSYCLLEDDEPVTDFYAKALSEYIPWKEEGDRLRYRLMPEEVSQILADDENPRIPYEDSVFYGIQVRTFTAASNSGVKKKGTFLGISEKIPYLKDLGVTGVELMPIVEFDEIIRYNSKSSLSALMYEDPEKTEQKCNLWGYEKALYYCPKSGFSAGNPQMEFATLVRNLHQAGLEVICQFYFPDKTNQNDILEVLKFWAVTYHVDGFHLKGNDLPLRQITEEPSLASTKLIYYGFDADGLYGPGVIPEERTLASFTDRYMERMRCFLKGDNDSIRDAFELFRQNRSNLAFVNYITNYDTFSLYDTFSYDKKHNEENGENNNDGRDYNYSWNCGEEGPTRKKAVLALRKKMCKNAMALLLTSQGTPFLRMGDEFLNSNLGNNNAYCQDNEISYLNWDLKKTNATFYRFTRELIAFRKAHGHLHQKRPLSMVDSYGYMLPDLSVHSDEAWKGKLNNYDHTMGMMFCGPYVHEKMHLYVGMNAYWQAEPLALPALKDLSWEIVIATDPSCEITDHQVLMAPRSMCVLRTKEEKEKT